MTQEKKLLDLYEPVHAAVTSTLIGEPITIGDLHPWQFCRAASNEILALVGTSGTIGWLCAWFTAMDVGSERDMERRMTWMVLAGFPIGDDIENYTKVANVLVSCLTELVLGLASAYGEEPLAFWSTRIRDSAAYLVTLDFPSTPQEGA